MQHFTLFPLLKFPFSLFSLFWYLSPLRNYFFFLIHFVFRYLSINSLKNQQQHTFCTEFLKFSPSHTYNCLQGISARPYCQHLNAILSKMQQDLNHTSHLCIHFPSQSYSKDPLNLNSIFWLIELAKLEPWTTHWPSPLSLPPLL